MTHNQIENKKVEEEKRKNRMSERQREAELKEERFKNRTNLALNTFKPMSNLLSKNYGSLGSNDPAWYNKDKQLVKDVASISFNTPLGLPYSNEATKLIADGILAIGFMPSIGNTEDSLDSNSANVAAKNIYAYVRHANSGSRNYEASDLLMYILGMDSAVSLWAALRRIYSLLMTSKSHNRYWVNSMLVAAGVDPDDLRNHIADFRALINSMRVKLNSLYVPTDMPIFARHVWMNSTIWKDQPVKKSQEYLFVQERYYHYDDVNGKLTTIFEGDGAMPLNTIKFAPQSNLTFSQIKSYVNAVITPLFTSEDIGIMSGDILKAYQDHIYYLEDTPEDYHIESQYDEEVLSQITNAILTNADSGTNNFDIKQDTQSRIYQGVGYYNYPNVSTSIVGYGIPCDLGQTNLSTTVMPYLKGDNHELNMYKDDVSPDEVMVATRLMVGWRADVSIKASSVTGRIPTCVVTSCGTEICTKAYSLVLSANGGTLIHRVVTFINNPQSLINMAEYYCLMAKYDWAPVVYIFHTNATIEEIALMNTRDIANNASISRQNLDNMHYVAVISELGIPDIGVKVRTR